MVSSTVDTFLELFFKAMSLAALSRAMLYHLPLIRLAICCQPDKDSLLTFAVNLPRIN